MTPRKGSGSYPDNWREVAAELKEQAGWRCARCGHPAERPGERIPCDEHCDASRHPGGLNDGRQRVLTVHHLGMHKNDTQWFLCVPVCQVCHLHIQHKVVMERIWYGEHSAWFRPYVAGWTAFHLLGIELDRDTATRYADLLIGLHQGTLTAEDVRRVMRYEGVTA